MEEVELTNSQYESLCFYTGSSSNEDNYIVDKDVALDYLIAFMDSYDYKRIVKSDKKYVIFVKCNQM